MRAVVGGTVYTVGDDMHASVLRDPTCSADLVSYFTTGFTTGRIGPGCPGLVARGWLPPDTGTMGRRFYSPGGCGRAVL